MYAPITKQVELELAPITLNPTAIGQFYKYISFFQVYLFIYLKLKHCCLNVSLFHVQSSAYWCKLNPQGLVHGSSLPGVMREAQPPLKSHFSFHPMGPGALLLREGSECCKYVYDCHCIIHASVITKRWNIWMTEQSLYSINLSMLWVPSYVIKFYGRLSSVRLLSQQPFKKF